MPTLRDLQLVVDASVPRTATFAQAAHALAAAGLSAVAVLEEDGRVAGLFTEDDFVAGLFPRYLSELRHTAFATADLASSLQERARLVGAEPVDRHMRDPITVEADTSLIHAAEVFLHCEWGAVALVDERKRYVGMLSQVELCRRLLSTLEP